MSEQHDQQDQQAANVGEHFSTVEREALIRLCEQREAVAGFLWPSDSDCREKTRLEAGLEQLLDLIKYE